MIRTMKQLKRTAWSIPVFVFLCICPVLRAAEPDATIEVSISKSYIYRVYLKEDAIKTEVSGGVVTLTGQVNELSHKILAQEVAAGYPGVIQVVNKLAVKLDGSEKSDTWIRAKVQSVLELHRNVSDSNTQVDVKDGVITLRGEASTDVQRNLAEAYTGDIKEVVRVINVMTVNPNIKIPPPILDTAIDDASVAALVKTALFNHRSTASLRTRVQALNGEVSISGVAQNAEGKANVTRLVSDLRGVTSVKNMMVIEDQ